MNTVSIHTLGCKLNYAESGALSEAFRDRDFSVLPPGESADVAVINTCSVTEEADRKCRQIIRRALRNNPDTYIIVTGCYAQLQPAAIAAIPGVDAILGAHEKFHLFDLVKSFKKRNQTQISVSCIDDIESFGPAYASGDRTRAFLKVQDGCDYTCSFCTIPRARGRSRSATISGIISQAEEIVSKGFCEIVLSGVNIGLFGNDTNENLLDLLRALDLVEGIDRYRISSIEPNLLTDGIIQFVAASDKFAPHFHIPLQSGDNEILGLMRRRYQRERYSDRVAQIKSMMPDACIGVDVIVGFPGESDDHFLNTFKFLENLPISYLHVFTYSERPDTTAVDSVHDNPALSVPKTVRNSRNATLRKLSASKRVSFYREQLGSERMVLWEATERNRTMFGFTDNYVRAEKQFNTESVNQLERVRLSTLTEHGTVTTESPDFVSILSV